MPPKGRKRVVAEAKGNGVQENELPAGNLKSRSGRTRKVAKVEEALEADPILPVETNDDAPRIENGSSKEILPEEKSDISEENVNGKVEISDEKNAVPARQRKKVVKPEHLESEISKEKDSLANPIPVIEVETKPETVSAPVKRGRKKAVEQTSSKPDEEKKANEVVEAEVVEAEQEQMPAKRGRKKAAVQEKTEKSDEVVETEDTKAKVEPEKVTGKRGRKKAGEPSNQGEMEEAPKPVAPAKRLRNAKTGAVVEQPEDDDDFAPRKTRGARNAKEVTKVVAPVARGRKRKVADVKDTKKGKVMKKAEDQKLEIQIDDNRELRVEIQRDVDLDERAKNTSKEEEDLEAEMDEEEDENVKVGKAKATAGRKRANKKEDDAKPAKAKNEVAPKSAENETSDVTDLDFDNSSQTPDGKPWNFKIISWNINGVRSWLEKNGLSYLNQEQPDILCVQETKCSDAKLPSEVEAVEGYHCHWLAGEREGYSGVGILSKKKPISIKNGIGIEEHDNEGRVITAEYEEFYLVASYVPNAGRGLVRLDYRKKWDEDFRAYIKKLDEEKPVVLCGDLNVAHEEIDLANPKTNKKNAGFTQDERDGFSTLLEEGFVDTFRHLYPDTKDAYTFWTYMMNSRAKNVGWRLDYFVISKRFTDNLCDSIIRKDVTGSDHCPIGLFLHV